MLLQFVNISYEILVLMLVAFGLAISFGMLRIMNMAHGELLMLGAYAGLLVQKASLPYYWALPLGFLLAGLAGFIMERLLIKHLYHRPLDSFIITWGVAILLREICEAIFGAGYQSLNVPQWKLPFTSSFDYPSYRLIIMTFIIISAILLVLWYRKSNVRHKIIATIDNPELAQSLGINTNRIATVGFTVSAASAGLAGALLAPIIRLDPTIGIPYLLDSLFVLIVGGLGSLAGLGIGALIIGGVETSISYITTQTIGYFTVLVVAILFLWIKPHGIAPRS
ncbi:MAG: branched-chain amino acid ABC transporter permease [Alphaproteobacteria bacterium]|nr:branched-chain amino acid ABC transporter permease [Alphaproteobacteria bacterium]